MENNYRILAIDDVEDNLISLKALIRESFPESLVFTALSGAEGLEIAADIEPDVILLDIVMPMMDGYEVCMKLKSNPQLKDIPVVFVTALKGDKDSRIKALDCGAEAFLAKPIDQSELIAQIRAMVKIKLANTERRDENKRLAKLVEEQTREIQSAHTATKNLLYNLRNEYKKSKQAEETIRQSEENYKNLVHHSPNIIYKFSNKRGGIFWSERVYEILGFTQFDLLDDPFLWNNSIHADDKPAVEKAIAESQNGHTFDIDYRIITKDGRYIWLNDQFMHKTIDGDEIIIEGIATDITKRKQAEAAVIEANDRYRMIFDNTGTANSIFDRNCKLILQNKISAQNLGLSVEDAFGKSVFDIFGDKGQIVYDRMTRVLNTGESETFDTRFTLLTGTKWFRSSYQPLFDNQNEVIGIQIISQDISDKKHIESLQNITNNVVSLLNENKEISEIANNILQLIHTETEFDALGIRLKNGEDYPLFGNCWFPRIVSKIREFIKCKK